MPEASAGGITKVVLTDPTGVPYDLTGGGGGSGAGTIMDRVSFTADVTVSGTTEAGATPIVSGNGFTADGVSSYWVRFFSPGVIPAAVNGAVVNFYLFLDGNPISAGHSLWGQVAVPAGATMCVPVLLEYYVPTPASGTRTFSARASRGANNGTVRGNTVNLGLEGYICVLKA